jgi:hypothetical protein
MPMGAIQVKDVPEELHEALRRRAIQEGMTMADDGLDLIRRDLGLPSPGSGWNGSRPESRSTSAPTPSWRRSMPSGPSGTPTSPPPWAGGTPRSTMPVVIGASALVELLLQSERAPAVLQAVGATDMVAPDAINPEVLSTLRRFERIGELRAGRPCRPWTTCWRPMCAASPRSRCFRSRGRCRPTSPRRRLLRRPGPEPRVPVGHRRPTAIPGAGAGCAVDHRVARRAAKEPVRSGIGVEGNRMAGVG